MIWHAATLTPGQLAARVAVEVPGWQVNASLRVSAIATAGKFVGKGSIWGDIKPVFMALQQDKCVFCERPLAGRTAGRIEQDVEHFRPKNAVKAWPRSVPVPAYGVGTGTAHPVGYYWLAYELENYAASCKPCNSARKSNAFPIAGVRGAPSDTIAQLNAVEKPLLIFPLGMAGEDPELLITFEGIVARPVSQSGFNAERARIIIDFFLLNGREELWRDRFRTIAGLFDAAAVANTHADPARRAAAQRRMTEMLSDAGPQAACARSFHAVMTSNPAKAWQIYLAAEAFMHSAAVRP